MSITVGLISPENSGNIGAIARLISNFNAKNLIIINPVADHLNKEALDRSSHAKKVLKRARVLEGSIEDIKKILKKEFHKIIATTSKRGRDYNILRTLEDVKNLKTQINKKEKVLILFGRESNGLTNEELTLADYTVTINANPKYPVLNLSHAVGIVLYELFQSNEKQNKRIASVKELNVLKSLINETLNNMNFAKRTQKKTQILVWNKLISKNVLSRRETFALIGYFKKLLNKR